MTTSSNLSPPETRRRRAGAAGAGLTPVPQVIDLREVDLEDLDVASLSVHPYDHLTLDGDHALGARLTDPLAAGLFALLRNDCHADRLLVWQELANTLGGELDDDAQLALAAARVCCDDLAEADPTRDFTSDPIAEREYKAWWTADDERRRSWPSVSSVRRWLGDGSWAKVVEHLGQAPTPGALAQRMSAQLGAFSPEELKAQLALARKELSDQPEHPVDYISQRAHFAWARQRLRDPNLPLARLCLQPHPFRSVFGSWAEAVEASGGCQSEAGRRAAASAAHSHDAYTSDACVEAVRYVGQRAGGPRMRCPDYDVAARSLKRATDPPDDLPTLLPAAQTIIGVLGSWPEALHKAGFIDVAERDRRLARVSVRLNDDKLLAVLADALRAIGADAPRQRYERYRTQMREKHGPHVGLPSLATVYQRLGPWPDAKAAVLAVFPASRAANPADKKKVIA